MAINKVGSKGITDGSVATAQFPDCEVTSAKLTDGTIANAKLVNSSVTLAGQSISLGGSVDTNLTDWQSVVTADGSTTTTAVSGQGYFIDTTSASHTINLPVSASIGDFVAIKDYAGTFGTNNLTIGRNGHNIQGVANDSSISTNRASLVLVYVDATKGWLYWEEHNVGDLQSPFIIASGGTETTDGDFKVHTFTGDGCFSVTYSGGPTGSTTVDYLVVAGGGGGANYNGGGGAGGYRESYPNPATGGFPMSVTTYPITVGAGGAGAPAPGYNRGNSGSNSIFSSVTSTGGGGGGTYSPGPGGVEIGLSGGSGGGGGVIENPRDTSVLPGSAGAGNTPPVSPSQGNPGGLGTKRTGTPSNDYGGGGGGGGHNASGQNGTADDTSVGGNGGNGSPSTISGSNVTRAGGGGGTVGGSGGSGGGGTGASTPNTTTGTDATANTGGGGGATRGSSINGGSGGKGIVVIRYKYQ